MEKLRYHESIRKLLYDIANLNPEEGPDELICLWFDDLYHPVAFPPEKYSPEVNKKYNGQWESCFNKEELEAMANFNEIYRPEIKLLSTDINWRDDPRWLNVSEAAAIALTKFRNSD